MPYMGTLGGKKKVNGEFSHTNWSYRQYWIDCCMLIHVTSCCNNVAKIANNN